VALILEEDPLSSLSKFKEDFLIRKMYIQSIHSVAIHKECIKIKNVLKLVREQNKREETQIGCTSVFTIVLVYLFIQRFSQHVSVIYDHYQAALICTLTPVFLRFLPTLASVYIWR
jgi:hypothetical protein